MQFLILGPLEVRGAGRPLPIGGPKPRAILAMLLLHANRPVSAERLAVALWGEEARRDAVKTVRVNVSRLRAALPEPDLLATTPAGYRLHVEDLDAERFTELVAAARAAGPERAAALLRDALGLWRGPALADFAHEPFAQAEAVRLEEQRLAALAARVDADLALGRHADLIGELRQLASVHPLREQLHARLMLALYRSGRQADALEAYRGARETLVEQLGLEPGRELRELERAILAHDPALAAPAVGDGGVMPSAPEAVDADAVVAFALPRAVAREAGHGPFVGRDAALERLRGRWADALAGERQFVLLTGEPGIGKTRLAAEVAHELHEQGATVLYGRSDGESVVPYQPFMAALRPHVDLAGLLPDPAGADVPTAEDAQTRRYRLHEAVARVLAAAAAERPVLLLLDDLHWADTATALMLSHLLGVDEPARLLILGMTRDVTEPLARLPLERLDLRGLDAADTGALAGGDVTDDFARLLHERTDGNPLFIHEMLRSLAGDEGRLRSGGVPEGVKETIARRLAWLSEPARDMLATAATAGREFRLELMEALLGRPAHALVEEAVAARLVRAVEEDPGRFVFAHALVQEALYERQSVGSRQQTHRRIGEALEDAGARPAEIAHHYSLARSPHAVRFSILAAREAAAALAFEEAAEHYRRALGALDAPEPRRHCELLLALGGVERAAGSLAARDSYAQAAAIARRAGLTVQLGQAALGFPHPLAASGALDHDAVDLLEEALAALGAHDDPLVAKLLARLANVLHFHGAEQRTDALSGAALEMARRLDDPDALVAALESRQTAHFDAAFLDERLALSDEMIALARRIGARDIEALAQFRRTYSLLEAGRLDDARAAHRTFAALAEELRLPILQHAAACLDVVWAGIEDRVDEAWALAERALQIGIRTQTRSAEIDHAGHTLALLHQEGRLAEHVRDVDALVGAYPHLVIYRPVLCLAQLQAGERAAGIASFEALAADDFASVPRDMLWLTVVCLLAEACALIGDRERADVLYELLLPFRDRHVQVGIVGHWGSAEHYLALLAATIGDKAGAAAHDAAARQANAGVWSARKRSSAATSSGGANR